MQALTLTQLAAINHAVDEIARAERVQVITLNGTWTETHAARRSALLAVLEAMDRCAELDVAALVPDEDEIVEQQRAALRADLMAKYAGKHPADETYGAWLLRVASTGLRGRRYDIARLYPGEFQACEHCGAIDTTSESVSADRAASPHARFCPMRTPSAAPESVKSVRATVRSAGANELHRVILTDEQGAESVVGERRSAHRYGYALCRWINRGGARTVAVEGWSRTATRRIPGCFPLAVERTD